MKKSPLPFGVHCSVPLGNVGGQRVKTQWVVRSRTTGRLPQDGGGPDIGDVYCARRFTRAEAMAFSAAHPNYEAVTVKAAHRDERRTQAAMRN